MTDLNGAAYTQCARSFSIKNQQNFSGLVAFVPRVCFCLAIEVLHEHRAGDNQGNDQLARARGEARFCLPGTAAQGL